MDLPAEDLVEMVSQDPSMVAHIVAPAGSTLLFGESLVHATSPITSDRERTIIASSCEFIHWWRLRLTFNCPTQHQNNSACLPACLTYLPACRPVADGPCFMPYWDDGSLYDDTRRQEGWTLSPAFRASITAPRNVAAAGSCETLLLGRRHWGRRPRHRRGLLASQDPRAKEQALPYWEIPEMDQSESCSVACRGGGRAATPKL